MDVCLFGFIARRKVPSGRCIRAFVFHQGGVMAKYLALSAWAIFLVSGLFASLGHAQVNSCQTQVTCSVYSLYYAECLPPIPLGASCSENGPWSATCSVATSSC